MKPNEITFPHDTASCFLRSILLDAFEPWSPDTEAQRDRIRSIVEAAGTVDELIDAILADGSLYDTQLYCELSKRERPEGHWKRIRSIFGDRQIKTVSDAGGLKIGNDSFSVIVPNGRGDGTTRVAIFRKDELPHGLLSDMMNYFTAVSGDRINVYLSDCGTEIVTTISGSYHVYYYDGLVALEQFA